MKWYLRAFRLYAVFSGRDSRKAFWMFMLFNILVSLVLGIVDGMILGMQGGLSEGVPFGILSGLYILASFLPTLAAQVRRLHDAGYSGWWVLLSFVPLIGPIALIVLLILPSEPGPNRYGPPPAE